MKKLQKPVENCDENKIQAYSGESGNGCNCC